MIWLVFGLAIVSILVHALGTFAGDDGLYWSVWWWDILSHVVAGSTVTLSIFTVVTSLTTTPVLVDTTTISGVLLVGLLWEYYEFRFWNEHEIGERLYPEDTALDLCTELLVATLILLTNHHHPIA